MLIWFFIVHIYAVASCDATYVGKVLAVALSYSLCLYPLYSEVIKCTTDTYLFCLALVFIRFNI